MITVYNFLKCIPCEMCKQTVHIHDDETRINHTVMKCIGHYENCPNFKHKF